MYDYVIFANARLVLYTYNVSMNIANNYYVGNIKHIIDKRIRRWISLELSFKTSNSWKRVYFYVHSGKVSLFGV